MYYLQNHVMHLHPMTYNYSMCYLQNRTFYDNIKTRVPMAPNKYKHVTKCTIP